MELALLPADVLKLESSVALPEGLPVCASSFFVVPDALVAEASAEEEPPDAKNFK